MAYRKTAHITFRGKPLCQTHILQCVAHPMAKAANHQCSFVSIAAANRAKLELQKHAWGFKVVRGRCPAFEKEAK